MIKVKTPFPSYNCSVFSILIQHSVMNTREIVKSCFKPTVFMRIWILKNCKTFLRHWHKFDKLFLLHASRSPDSYRGHVLCHVGQ